jgi:O-antigen ligase
MTSFAYAALWLFIFSLPWEGVIRVGGVSVVSRLTGMLALAVALLAVVITGKVRRWHAFHVAALRFVLCAGAELFFFHSGERLPAKYFTYVQLFAVLWMIWELAPSRSRVHALMLAYVFGAYVASLDTLRLYRAEGSSLRRFAAGGVDPNDLAMALALAVPMAWYLSLNYRKPLLRWLCRGYLPVGLLAIALTGSRGGMITTVFALLIVPGSMTKLTPGRLATAIAMLALSGALAVAYVPDKVVERLASTQTDVEDLRFGGRFKLWVAGLQAFTQKPMLGYGTAGFIPAIYPILGSKSQVAHNSYLSILVEQGIVGFVFYMWMILAAWRAVRRLPKWDRRFAFILLASLALAMSPLTWEDRKPVWFILAVMVGLAYSYFPAAARGAGLGGPGARAAAVPPWRRSARPLQPVNAAGTDRPA